MPRSGTRTLLFAGLAAALCWTAADVLLVGFVPEPQRHPWLAETLPFGADFAAMLQSAPPGRLFWGVPPATFSLPLYLAAAFGVRRLMQPGRSADTAFILLFASYSLMPLAHAGFYYLGIATQTLLSAPPDKRLIPVAQFLHFYRMLALHWISAVGLLFSGWLLFGIQTLRSRTRLPKSAALLTPVPVCLAVALLCGLFPQSVFAASIGGAAFNLSQAVFFATALLLIHIQPKNPTP